MMLQSNTDGDDDSMVINCFLFKILCSLQELAAYLKSYVRSSISADSSANSSQLQCQCPTVDGVKYCANGSDVIMDWRFWAGGDKGSLPLNVPEPLDYVEDLQVSSTEFDVLYPVYRRPLFIYTKLKFFPWQTELTTKLVLAIALTSLYYMVKGRGGKYKLNKHGMTAHGCDKAVL